ncbi:MAG: LiaF domain-containing protein [Prevotella sp.]
MTRVIIGLVLLVYGVSELLTITGVYDTSWLYRYPWVDYVLPICAILASLKMLSPHHSCRQENWNTKRLPDPNTDNLTRMAVSFGGDYYNCDGEVLRDASVEVFMGGIKLDLRNAVLDKDVNIDIRTFMGGVEILFPENANLRVYSQSFIGGVEKNGVVNKPDNPYTIHVSARNFMGGVSVKA